MNLQIAKQSTLSVADHNPFAPQSPTIPEPNKDYQL